MTANSRDSYIEGVIANAGRNRAAATALITDFIRVLHEFMVKTKDDQKSLLFQVEAVFGPSTKLHLANTLGAQVGKVTINGKVDHASLTEQIDMICRQRNFEPEEGKSLIARFLKALDHGRTDRAGNVEAGPILLYWGVGHEAAYHLVGLYLDDRRNMNATALFGYLDPTLKRFHNVVEMWHEEQRYSQEASA